MVTPPDQPYITTSLALGRVLALPQGLGGYTHGCADVPPRRKLHTFEDHNPQPSTRAFSSFQLVLGSESDPSPPIASNSKQGRMHPTLLLISILLCKAAQTLPSVWR